MGGGGRDHKGSTSERGAPHPLATPQAPPGLDASRSAPLLDPMRFQRQERAAAVAQIDRSLRAWRKAAGGPAAGAAAMPEGGGSPLASDTRAKMEGQLGADLSAARIHTGGDSAKAASGIGARAFTVGRDVHFGSGEYAPGSKEGDRLLAHELTHVVQGQKSGVQRKPEANGEHAAGDAEVSHPHEPAEQEADAAGDRAAEALHGGDGKAGQLGAAAAHADGKAASEGGKAGGADEKAGAGGAEHAGGPQAGVVHEAGHDAGSAKAFRKPLTIQAAAPRLKIFGKWTEFKDLANNQKGPTSDPTHPHLVELGITNLGPYKYMPLKGEFQYAAPSDLTAAWSHADATVGFQPEAPPKPQPQVKAADKVARIAAAKAKFGPGMAEILAHDGGNTPRPFTGVADEDTRGAAAGAHNVARHCLSSASDMKTRDDVALRAAFGMIGGVVSGVYTPTASAFASPAAANGTIAPALNGALTTSWMSWRALLAAGKNPSPGGVQGAAGSGNVIFKSVGGAQLPVVQVPKYLGLDPSHKGVSPLFAGDARWQQWWNGNPQERKDYEKANGVNAKPPALTTDASAGAAGISMRVLPDVSPGNGGWILHAAWPV